MCCGRGLMLSARGSDSDGGGGWPARRGAARRGGGGVSWMASGRAGEQCRRSHRQRRAATHASRSSLLLFVDRDWRLSPARRTPIATPPLPPQRAPAAGGAVYQLVSCIDRRRRCGQHRTAYDRSAARLLVYGNGRICWSLRYDINIKQYELFVSDWLQPA